MGRLRSQHGAPISAALLCLALAVAATQPGAGRGRAIGLVVAQTAGVICLGQLGWSRSRGWAAATVLFGAGWALTLLVPSWIYAVDPGLLDVGRPASPLAIVDLSLVAMLVGFAPMRQRLAGGGASFISLVPVVTVPLRVAAWILVGFVALAIVLFTSGGPIGYVRHLSQEGSLTQGKTYFIILALAIVFAVQAVICGRWSSGRSSGMLPTLGFVAALILVGILGSRLFIAGALAQLTLFYGLVRRRPRLRTLLGVGAVTAAVLILGVGAVKRYSNYQAAHPGSGMSLGRYLTSVAPGEIPAAYSNNYADGVRVLALARATVPRHAGYEYGKELLRLLLQPIPHSIRPSVATAPAIEAAIYPPDAGSYAQPLQAVSYLQFGLPGVVVTFLALGVALAALDARLEAIERARPSTVMLLCAVVVSILEILRGAAAAGVATIISVLIVLYLVMRSSERLLGPGQPGEPGSATANERPAPSLGG
jgi:hypothetical protein